MAKKRVTADELIWIFHQRLAEVVEYGRRVPIAVIPTKGSWSARTNSQSLSLYPGCVDIIEQLEVELRRDYHLIRN